MNLFYLQLVDVTSILKDCGFPAFSSSDSDFAIKAIRCPLGAVSEDFTLF